MADSKTGTNPSRPRARGRPADTDPVGDSVEQLARLIRRDERALSRGDRIANAMTAFSGSMVFVALHALWFSVWMLLNLGVFGLPAFDPFPFGLLTLVVSLEAIFLSTFVLISQNRQAQLADHRQKVTLEVDVLAEQETTKLLRMMAEIHHLLGLHSDDDEELHRLEQSTRLEELAERIETAEAATTQRNGRHVSQV